MGLYTLSNILDGVYYDISPLRRVYHVDNNDMHDYLIQVGNGGKYYIPCTIGFIPCISSAIGICKHVIAVITCTTYINS